MLIHDIDPAGRVCKYIPSFPCCSALTDICTWLLVESNPMLAETFEDVRMKFIAEKVQHHPFAMAYHAEGAGWELYATSAGKTKFWGRQRFRYRTLTMTDCAWIR